MVHTASSSADTEQLSAAGTHYQLPDSVGPADGKDIYFYLHLVRNSRLDLFLSPLALVM